jgi:dipeptidase
MCDTLIATKSATSNGVAIFGKNSDRPVNEGQHLAYFPALENAKNSRLKCTYIEIPQVERTHAVLLSKPFWMWGAEMGVNEYGLAIGNEAVYSKIPANKEPALLGMDMLRIALERSITPREALQVIIDLLDQFGQGGNCASHGESMYYHNSFLIANAEDAWVLETVDKQWAARQVRDVYSISNCLTIENQYDMASPDLIQLALQKGFTRSASQFRYATDYSDFLFTNFGKGHKRCATTTGLLEQKKGDFDVPAMMSTLRHHNEENYDPQNTSLTSVDVCMHAGFGPIHISQSTASMVVYLDGDRPIIFATGTSAPCTGIFKPVWMDALPALKNSLGPVPAARADSDSLFWTHERLHRATLLNYPERIKTYASDRNELENKFTRGAMNLAGATTNERADFSAQCFHEAAQAEQEWLKRVEQVPARKGILSTMAWNAFNKKAGMPKVR